MELPPLSKRIILASKSPRRKFLLEAAGFKIKVFNPDVDESLPEGMASDKIAIYLAEKKAEAARKILAGQDIIVAADSIVLLGSKILGKPKDLDHCRSMLKDLSGREHKVITGVCMVSREKKEVFSETTTVKFAKLTDAEIQFYIEQFRPFDKAGSYAIQEWIGYCKIEWIKGSYSNVMGLPVNKVYDRMANHVWFL